MIYIGIDPSLSGAGVVVLDEKGDIKIQKLISTKPKDQIEKRMNVILNEIEKTIDNENYNIVYIEGLSFGSKGQAMLELAGLHYVITQMLYNTENLRFKEIPPGTLKKFVTGKGNAKKNLMLLNTYKKFGVEFQDDNLCDAFCLAKKAFEDMKEN